MSRQQKFIKRLFDIIGSTIGILLLWWLIVAAWLVATIETRSYGLYFQTRIGRKGKRFLVIKIKTMYHAKEISNNITTSNDPRITKSGHLFRSSKIDELPQLWNVLIGNMSFVGPRPDVAGYADKLRGSDRIILTVRPGITGPASLKYKNEESLLSDQIDPIKYNDDVIWPDKVKINIDYICNYKFSKDIRFICQTFVS
jgi:lipopolysaccharide/colanic/teichoic acid biosynthesis glycosyltransferase